MQELMLFYTHTNNAAVLCNDGIVTFAFQARTSERTGSRAGKFQLT
jgi:hypothetical protein